MNVIAPDYPLLVAGLVLVIWARVWQPRYVFHLLCQAVATVNAQYSLGLSLSLGRLVPILASTSPRRFEPGLTRWFLPFVLYAIGLTLIQSQRWAIPHGISPFYGEFRFVVQLINFITLALSASALYEVLRHPRAPLLAADMLTGINIIHGLASIYQLVAAHMGLPLIGISRPHSSVVDVASQAIGDASLLRPGGLAGEPKSAAVIFGAYLIVRAFGMPIRTMTPRRRFIEGAALVIASFAFLETLSTSAFFGAAAGAAVLVVRFPGSLRSILLRLTAIGGFALLGWTLSSSDSEIQIMDVLRLRTVDRFQDESTALDPPVAACLDAIEADLTIATFGTGLGGSSFIVMRSLGSTDLSYAPNISLVLAVTELGMLGTLLMLIPVTVLYFRGVRARDPTTYSAARFYFTLSIGTLAIQLAGSGIPMGFSLAIGALCAANSVGEKGFCPEAGA